jgi:PPOX class probable F420-dependent enzyme
MPMTPEEIDEFLLDARPHLAHVSTIDATGRPRIRPLWYLWRDRALWLTTRMEARHTGRDLKSNPYVAASIASEDRPYRAVIVHGKPEIVGKDEELLLAISTRYGAAAGKRWTATAMREPDRVILKLVPETLLTWNYAHERTDGPKRTILSG